MSVEATTGIATSLVPRTIDRTGSSPSSRQRNTLSSTTIALSTRLPTPSASPPSEMMLSVIPERCIGANVARIEIGIVRPMISVWGRFRRNRYSTITAITPPWIALSRTSSIEFLMKTDWSESTCNETPPGSWKARKSVSRRWSSSRCARDRSAALPDSVGRFFEGGPLALTRAFPRSGPAGPASPSFSAATYACCSGEPSRASRTVSATTSTFASASL